jgi:hypothetical protein
LLVVANEAGPVLVVELKPAKLVSVPSMMKMGVMFAEQVLSP